MALVPPMENQSAISPCCSTHDFMQILSLKKAISHCCLHVWSRSVIACSMRVSRLVAGLDKKAISQICCLRCFHWILCGCKVVPSAKMALHNLGFGSQKRSVIAVCEFGFVCC